MKLAPTKSFYSLNTPLQYFTLKSTDYWHLQYNLNSNWKDYHWDMSAKASLCELERDKEGITLYYGEDGEAYYSIIELAQYAMASYQMYRKTNKDYWYLESKKHLEKVLSLVVKFKDCPYALLNKHPHALYGMKKPWPSSLSYGVTISLLVRFYELEQNKIFLKYANNLAENFLIDINGGGVRRHINDKSIIILEEYPSANLSGVLNGHITALWSLYDLGCYEEKYKDLFSNITDQLAKNIYLWDAEYWSYYDLVELENGKRNLASIHYHMLHIQQLLILYKMSNNVFFAKYAEKFIRNKYSILNRSRAFLSKVRYRLLYKR